MEISDLQELIAIFSDLRDCNVQLQVLDWKITKVLDLRCIEETCFFFFLNISFWGPALFSNT